MRWTSISIIALAGLSLSGCSAFVPSWNAQPTPIEINNESEAPDVNESEQEQAEPEILETQPENESNSEAQQQEVIEQEAVTVEIVDAAFYQDTSRLEVVAQVVGLVESGGECSLKFLAGDFSLESSIGAEDSSTYTVCSLYVAESELPSGTAVVSVTYSSDSHRGESAPVSVVIP